MSQELVSWWPWGIQLCWVSPWNHFPYTRLLKYPSKSPLRSDNSDFPVPNAKTGSSTSCLCPLPFLSNELLKNFSSFQPMVSPGTVSTSLSFRAPNLKARLIRRKLPNKITSKIDDFTWETKSLASFWCLMINGSTFSHTTTKVVSVFQRIHYVEMFYRKIMPIGFDDGFSWNRI